MPYGTRITSVAVEEGLKESEAFPICSCCHLPKCPQLGSIWQPGMCIRKYELRYGCLLIGSGEERRISSACSPMINRPTGLRHWLSQTPLSTKEEHPECAVVMSMSKDWLQYGFSHYSPDRVGRRVGSDAYTFPSIRNWREPTVILENLDWHRTIGDSD